MGVTIHQMLLGIQKRPDLRSDWTKDQRKSTAYTQYVSMLRRFLIDTHPCESPLRAFNNVKICFPANFFSISAKYRRFSKSAESLRLGWLYFRLLIRIYPSNCESRSLKCLQRDGVNQGEKCNSPLGLSSANSFRADNLSRIYCSLPY